jgi:hypothetical protein
MAKSNHVGKNPPPAKDDRLAPIAQNYRIGNFHLVRAQSKELLRRPDLPEDLRAKILEYVKMCGVDVVVMLTGVVSFFFTLTVALVTAY